MNRVEERKIIQTVHTMCSLICDNYKWCSDCPLHISQGDKLLTKCSVLELIHTFEKIMDRRTKNDKL